MPISLPTVTRTPRLPWTPDRPRAGTQFEVYTSNGIVCIGGGFYSDPSTGVLIDVPGVWTGHDVRRDGWAVAVVLTTLEASNFAGIRLVAAPDPRPETVPGPDGGEYPLVLARIQGRSILPVLAGHPLVFSPP